jgi:hypothetical protein
MMLALAIKRWTPAKWARIVEQTIISEHEAAIKAAVTQGTPLPPGADRAWVGRAVLGINSLFRFDLRLEDQAETTTEREAVMQQAIDLTGMLPDPAKAAIVPDILRMSDFPGKDEMATKAEAALAPPPMPGAGMPGMPPDVPPLPEGPPAEGLMPPGFTG